ncbi:MAG: GTPase Era [Alphaproteobacteria bacterium]|nr:GTPase Era [Alphaproteobacteria bacterium]
MLNTKCAFIAVVGEPNAGKSTLVNKIVGEKISIVSPKVQTTRRQVRGIVNLDNSQIVFIDTPGFCKSKTPLEKAISTNFKNAYKDADIVLLVIDATSKYKTASFTFAEKMTRLNIPLIVAINKVDSASKESILETAKRLNDIKHIENVFMVSALTDDGLEDLIKTLKDLAPCGPWMYGAECITDMDLKFRLAEITREKIFLKLQKELPYSVYIETEFFKETEKKISVYQAIVVMKESHKGIIIGRNASMITEIKRAAISDMMAITNKKIELKLFVKVKEKWSEKISHLQNAGIID